MFGLFKRKNETIPTKSNELAKKIMDYQLYNPYLDKCDNKQVQIACKDCNCLKDVYHTAIKYIEDEESPFSVYLLAKANFGLGVLYTERTIYYSQKFLTMSLHFKTEEEKNQTLMEICDILSNCFKNDYLVNEELKYRKMTLDYSIAWWEDYKKKLQYPQPMEYYGNKNIRNRITELNNDIKIAKNISKQTGKEVDLSLPLTNRKVLKRIDIKTENIYNLITGETIKE